MPGAARGVKWAARSAACQEAGVVIWRAAVQQESAMEPAQGVVGVRGR